MFTRIEHKQIEDMISRFTIIINGLKSLAKSYSIQEQIRKILRSLPRAWRPKVTTIREVKKFSTLKLDELLGSLKVLEQEIMDEIHPKKEQNARSKSKKIHFKTN